MADGSHAFNFPLPQRSQLRPGEIVVDLFAGGGGASEALKQALGIDPALAYNHDEWAIGMHAANHPLTKHHREDIWHADPARDVAGRKVGWFHASPDCTHFSQAKGGQPRNGKIRSLSWVIPKWIGQLAKVGLAPRIVSMENVWQIRTWGPLVAKRDKATGRVLKIDGTVAAKGERVPVELQQLVPDKRRTGRTWRQFLAVLESFGYVGEARKLVASDYGAGTSRERLFGVWRRDGEPVVWPAPTHGKVPGLLPLVTAADCIDFSDLGRSIFDRPRPLADATMRRIAKGIVKHVLQADEPFFLTEFANASNGRTWSAAEPLRTQCAGVKGGHFAVVAPTLVQTGYGERAGQEPRVPGLGKPLGTIVAGGVKHALVSAFLEQACSGYYTGAGQDLRRPAPTICAKGSIQRLVTANMVTLRNNMAASDVREPLRTISAGGEHHGLVICELSPEIEAGAMRVAAFLIRYYSLGGQWGDLREPLDTVTTRDRMALVTVHLQGVPYVIVDIGLRMLKPAELFRAQGFPPGYIIDRTADGRQITTTAAVRMVGNSVSPPPLCALARANLDRAGVELRAAA
ncbi:MAG: DNA cytosine methyltransferase [Lysobacter sp.]